MPEVKHSDISIRKAVNIEIEKNILGTTAHGRSGAGRTHWNLGDCHCRDTWKKRKRGLA